jgi:hypothetical protein
MFTRHGLNVEGSVQNEEKGGPRALARLVADAEVFPRQSDGSTVASQYVQLRASPRCANTESMSDWAEILSRLGDSNVGLAEGGVAARLFLHERCARLIETFPALQHDPHRPEELLKADMGGGGNGGDDAANALRYLVATKSRAVPQRKLSGL